MDAKPRTGAIDRERCVRGRRSSLTIGLRFARVALALLVACIPSLAFGQEFTAKSLGDHGNVTVMEVNGNYDADNADGTSNVVPRETIAKEFFKTHKDEYDFIVIFSNFDFKMPEKETLAFYSGVKNDTQGIGKVLFDNTQLYGSNGRLQGTVDMGNIFKIVSDPLDPKFEETLITLSHEMMHRWAAHVKLRDASGAISTALLGETGVHWSFLLDTAGSVMYGNRWLDNGNGTFTSTTPESAMKSYSPLDLYLMGMIDKSKVPPMLLIENPDVDPTQLPRPGVTINGTARYVTIDDIIAANGPRIPDASTSQKSFKSAFIFIAAPGTFTGDELYGIENIRSGAITRVSVLTDGKSIMEVASTPKESIPTNPGIIVPAVTPRTLPPNVSDGVQWLVANQRPDGSWADLVQTGERDTAEATLAVRGFTATQANYQNGVQWLGGIASGNMDFLSRKIEALAGSGRDLSSLVSDVLSRQNADGGWGSDRNYASAPLDTALALRALFVAGYSGQQTIARAITYLKTCQNPDGGWGSEDKGSTVQETSNVLSAFNRFRTSYQLDDAITNGAALLVSKQNADGGFGNSPSTVYDTARAVMTLAELNSSSTILNSALSYLLGQQSDNGGWNQSAYQTALAVEAVNKATIDPDLSIKNGDISFIPAAVTSLPSNVVISAAVWNLGQTPVPQAKVALYDGDRVLGKKLGEQTLAFPGQASTTVTFSVAITDGNEHVFTVVVDPDDLVKEASELNNMAAVVFSPQATYDFEVLPQNITVSANPVNIQQDVTISAQITNKGTMNAYNVQVKYFIDDPASPFEIATQTVDIPAGATITNQATWRANKAGVNMPLAVLVDPFNTFTELSKSNNKASTTITVNGSTVANLTVSYKELGITPDPINQGNNATVSALVRNDGFSPAANVKVNFYIGVPGIDGVLLGSSILPLINPGEAVPAAMVWTNIQESGEKVIYVKVDPNNEIEEIRKDDNDAFRTLNILSLPDLAISASSVIIKPTTPKEGDPVTITVTVQNRGDQAAANVAVRLSEGGSVLGTLTIPALAGSATGTVSLSYDTSGKKGAHTITAVVDPDNVIVEQNKDNNAAANVFGVQDSSLWLTERYFSPNGDGVKDKTSVFFRLASTMSVTVAVLNSREETVRSFSGPDLTGISDGSVTWDGLDQEGRLVADGEYRIEVRGADGRIIGNLMVSVDTDRSPFIDAMGTKYLTNTNLTCMLPDSSNWQWFPDESGILYEVYGSGAPPEFPEGLYSISSDGQDVLTLVTSRVSSNLDASWGYSLSADGEKIAYVHRKAISNYVQMPELVQLIVMDRTGTNAKSVVSYTNSDGVDIYDAFWSPKGDSLFFTTYSNATMMELWVMKADGTIVKLDTGGTIWNDHLAWSPDGNSVVYAWGSLDGNSNYHEVLRVVEIGGNKRDIAVPLDSNSVFYVYYLGWLNSGRVILQEGNTLRLLDAWGTANPVAISPTERITQVLPSPAGDRIALGTGLYETWSLSIVDEQGRVFARPARLTGGECSPRINGIVWSPNGRSLAFSEYFEYYVGEGSYPCDEPYGPRVIVMDPTTHLENAFTNAMTPDAWLSDERTLMGTTRVVNSEGNYTWQTTVHSLDVLSGESRSMALPEKADVLPGKLLSPLEHSIVYRLAADSSSVCYGRKVWDGDLWSLTSLLNLTADLRPVREKSSVTLKGIAADLNFDGYQLEWADVKSPTAWNPVAPPSNVPVVNDVFTTWIPPYEGTFTVRLTARDKAGNAAMEMKRISWGTTTSITGIYKTLDAFSPNGDGVKDTVEIYYTVLEPVHLEFGIYDAGGNIVRTIQKDHAVPGSSFLSWDGTDGMGNVVPDGKYSIKVFDYEFFVGVDSTPPQVSAAFSAIYKDPKTYLLSVDLLGYVVDRNLRTWTMEYGYGENPQEWRTYVEGTEQIAILDDRGDPVTDPIPAKKIMTFDEQRIVPYIGAKIRLTAEDYAGNRTTVISNMLQETIYLDRFIKDKFGNIAYLSPGQLETGTTDIGAGNYVFGGLSTVTTPIVSRNVQYGIEKNSVMIWADSPVDPDGAGSGLYWTYWPNPGVPIDALRVKEVDELGSEHFSNILPVGYALMMDSCSLEVTDRLFQPLEWLEMIIQSSDDPHYAAPTVYAFLAAPPKRVPMFFELPKDLMAGRHYEVWARAKRVNGLTLDSPHAKYPSACKVEVSLTLDIKYEEGECGPAPGKADVTATLKKDNILTRINPRTLGYYLQKPSGPELLYQLDLTKQSWAGIQIDTNIYSEGTYTVSATLAYDNELGEAQKELTAEAKLVVDRVLPTSRITYPSGASLKLCPLMQHGATGDWFGIPVEVEAADNNSVATYELYYGSGEAPDTWMPATDRSKIGPDGKPSQITGKGSISGRIGTWDVSTLSGGTYTLKLRVIDVAGNASCSYATFSFDSSVDIVFADPGKRVVSPNGDGVFDVATVNYEINKYAVVDTRVYKALWTSSGYVLDATAVRTISAGIQHLGGAGSVLWDGKNDAGSAVPDGPYGVAVSAADACGNTALRWIIVEVDNTPPSVSIGYPKPGNLLGSIIEVRGSANDLHFQSFVLEVGQGSSPTAWIQIGSGLVPSSDVVLGKWSTFGLEGTWTIRLTALDAAGNKGVNESVIDLGTRQNLIKDMNTAPRIFSPNDDGILDATSVQYELTDACLVTLEFADATGAVKRTSTSVAPSPGVYTFTWNGRDGSGMVLPDGEYTVKLTASLTSNTSVIQTERNTVILDSTLPAVDIGQPANGAYLKTDVTVTGSISDANLNSYSLTNSGIGTAGSLDSGNQDRLNYVFGTLAGLAEGGYTLTVTATDLAGNSIRKNISYTIDRTPPAVKLDTPASGELYGGEKGAVSIAGSIVEKNLESFSLRYGSGDSPSTWTDLATGTTVTAYQSPYLWKVGKNDGVPDGTYTISLYAKDKAGLTGEAKVKVVVDNTAPSVALLSPAEGGFVKAATDLAGTADDVNLDKYILELSEGRCDVAQKWGAIGSGVKAVASGTLLSWKTLPQDGEYCLKLTASDKSGNRADAKVNFVIDTTPPAAPSLSGRVENKTGARLEWPKNGEPDIAGYDLYRNGRKLNSGLLVELSYLDADLAEGAYSYTLKAVDKAGWESPASTDVKVRIDVTGPSARIRVPQDGSRVSGLADIKGTAYSSDDFRQYRVSVGQGASPSAWTVLRTSPLAVSYGTLAQWDTFGAAEGDTYSIKLEAEDLSGNLTTHQISVTVDNQPPAQPQGLTVTAVVSDATVTWKTGTEPDLAGYLVYRNGQLANVAGVVVGDLKPYLVAPTPVTTSYSDRTLPDGTYTYFVMAVDQAGNTSEQSVQQTVKVDTRIPHAVIVEPAADSSTGKAAIGGKTLLRAECPDLDVVEMRFEYLTAQGTWTTLGTALKGRPYVTYFDPPVLGLPHGEYSVRAVASDTGNDGSLRPDPAPAALVLVYKDLTPPAAPSGFTTRVNGDAVNLTWLANTESDLAGYNLYRTAAGDVRVKINADVIPGSVQPSFLDPGLYDSTYFYEVTAVDKDSNESRPAGAKATVYAPVLDTPQYVTTKKKLRLTGSSAAPGSLVELYSAGTVTATTSADAAGRFQFDVILADGQNVFATRATDNKGNISRMSNAVTVEYLQGPAAPMFPAAFEIPEGGALKLTWDAAAGVGYNLYRGAMEGGPYAQINASLLTKTEYIDTGLTNGTPYYYVVATVDTQNLEGAYSEEARGIPNDRVAPDKPVIASPTRTSDPLTVYMGTATIMGYSEPRAAVELFRGGISQGTVVTTGSSGDQAYQFPDFLDSVALSPDERTAAYSTWTRNAYSLRLLSLESGDSSVISSNGDMPVWSPAGDRLLYVSYDPSWNEMIWVYTPASGTAVQLTGEPDSDEYEPVWSPDGTKIAYTSNRISGVYSVWLKDVSNGTLVRISSGADANSPTFSPDGSKLAYYDGGQAMVFDVAAGVSQVIEGDSDWGAMSWSPDSRELSAISYRNGYGDVYVYTPATGTSVQLTHLNDASDGYYDAVWSADGTRVVLKKWVNAESSYSLEIVPVHAQGDLKTIQSGIYPVYLERADSGAVVYAEGSVLHRLGLNGKFVFPGAALGAGENMFSVTASDEAGNKSDVSDPITLIYDDSRLTDLAVTVNDVYLYPPMPIVGERMAVNVAVRNAGVFDAYDVEALIYVWNAQGGLDLLTSERLPRIDAGSAVLVSASWDSAGMTGANRLVVVVDPYDGVRETDETNNMAVTDFLVADHEGITLITSVDSAVYRSNQTASIAVSIGNSGGPANGLLEVEIQDGNGNRVSAFDSRQLSLAYGSLSQAYVWNTGSTFAGAYTVHAVLRDVSGTTLAEGTAPFTITSDAADDLTVTTDKLVYGPQQNVVAAFQIKNSGTNSIIPSLAAKVSIVNSGGTILFTETRTVSNLLPGAFVDLRSTWNTGQNAPAQYTVTVEASFDGGATTTRSAAFTIQGTAVLTGSLTASPPVVPGGSAAQLSYTLANSGNLDALGYMVRVSILDPDTQTVVEARDMNADILANSSTSGEIAISTSGYGLKTYSALLQTVVQGTIKTIAGAFFTVRDLTPPAVSALRPTAGSVQPNAVQLAVSAADDRSGVDYVEYRIDEGAWQIMPVSDAAKGIYSAVWQNTLRDGSVHHVSFRAADKAANVGAPIDVAFTLMVEVEPTAPALIAPSEGSDVMTLRPTLEISKATDGNGDDLTYQFEIYADSGLTQFLASAGGVVTGAGSIQWQVPSELTENARYYWRSRAYDGTLFGPWMDTASFRVNVLNDPPIAPTIASPADGSNVSVLTPMLTVNNASDPDSAGLTYNFEIALDELFSQVVGTATGVAEGTGTTSWQVPTPLSENTMYYWRAQADDWLEAGPWSATAKFLVKTANVAPSVPVILSPVNNSVATATSVGITLQNSIDPDSSVISYYYEVDTVSTFDSPGIVRSGIIPAGAGTTTWQAIGLLDHTDYYVRAKATDGSAESEWSGTVKFFVNLANEAPTTPVIANPSDGAGVSTFTPTLSVQNSTDPDRDMLTYEFQVYSDVALSTLVVNTAGVTETPSTTSWTVPIALTEDQTYYWRARAFDGRLASGWTLASKFMVNTANDAPGAPIIVTPLDGGSVDTLTPMLTVLNAKDPENDKLTYDFELSDGTTIIWSATGITEGTLQTSVTVTTPIADNTVYQWRARAFDGSRYGPWTASVTFTAHLPQTGITVDLEIEPETLNQKSKGDWVMAEIELPHGYKTSDVDISSIRLEGTVPAVLWPREHKKDHHEHGCEHDRSEHDHGELKVKFRRSDVIAVLPVGEHVRVHVTGTVGGTPFEGVDVIRVTNGGCSDGH